MSRPIPKSSGSFFDSLAEALCGDVAKAGARAVDGIAKTVEERLAGEARKLAGARRQVRKRIEVELGPLDEPSAKDDREVIDAEFVEVQPKGK